MFQHIFQSFNQGNRLTGASVTLPRDLTYGWTSFGIADISSQDDVDNTLYTAMYYRDASNETIVGR